MCGVMVVETSLFVTQMSPGVPFTPAVPKGWAFIKLSGGKGLLSLITLRRRKGSKRKPVPPWLMHNGARSGLICKMLQHGQPLESHKDSFYVLEGLLTGSVCPLLRVTYQTSLQVFFLFCFLSFYNVKILPLVGAER